MKMKYEYIRELGANANEHNCAVAKVNLDSAIEAAKLSIARIEEGAEHYYENNEPYYLVRSERDIRQASRHLQIAVDDTVATYHGWFPTERDEIVYINKEDPRDWFFNFVNIGNCHDCPLHAHIRNNKNKPCGAEECVVKQLCALIGLKG
jgi:hypothetical protein